MPDPITPEALAEARELGDKYGEMLRPWSIVLEDHGLAALTHEVRAAATAAERERCAKVCERWRENLWAYPEDVNLCLRIENEIRRGE